jgi:hypothetical protein
MVLVSQADWTFLDSVRPKVPEALNEFAQNIVVSIISHGKIGFGVRTNRSSTTTSERIMVDCRDTTVPVWAALFSLVPKW